jgi:hypothetical protein
MISETSFAQHYTSAWKLLAPTTDLYVRKINLELYAREFRPLASATKPLRRALINETAFNLFALKNRPDEVEGDIVQLAYLRAKEKISTLKSSPILEPYPLEENEIEDCNQQEARLSIFFRNLAKEASLTFSPRFQGAGIVDTCNGDVLVGSTLIEVKAGQRTFRSIDIKQLLTYAALDRISGLSRITRLGIFNPRTGVSFCASVDEVCLEVSGCTSYELLPEIIRILSSGEISR